MYYVLYVGAGKENSAETLIQKIVPEELYGNCFHPIRHMKKKIHGDWKEIYERLIPGYVFITSEDILLLYMKLKSVPAFLKLLGKKEGETVPDFYPLNEKEIQWLEKISGKTREDGSMVVELSPVSFDEKDNVVILSGPLKGMEGQVRKINLHKRIAEVEVEFMNRKTVLYLGIEIVERVSGDNANNA